MSEFIALVDEHDNLLGREEKYACHRRTVDCDYGQLHRAFSLFIFHPDNSSRMLLQRRSESKHTFPMMWSNAVCSHPNDPQETSNVDVIEGVKRAAVRRAKQELGLDICLEQLTVTGRILYQAVASEEYAEWELDYLVFCRHDAQPDSINPAEVNQVMWIDMGSVMQVDDPTPWFHRLCKSGIMHRLWTQYCNGQPHYDMAIMRL